MTDTIKACGFYGTDEEVFYLTPSGRTWIVSSNDFDGIREIADLPAEAVACDHLMTPDEAIDYCRQVEAESGESLVSEA